MRNGTHLGTPAMSVEEAKYAVSLGMSVGKSLALQKFKQLHSEMSVKDVCFPH